MKGFITVEERAMTDEELALVAWAEKQNKIVELKAKLSASDYQAIKYAEGLISTEEYAETKAQRQAWRNEINELEERQ